MFDTWKLQDYDPGKGVAAGAYLPDYDDSTWITVNAPGDVHKALIAAGRIEDPFYDQNETKCRWMEEKEWWYRLKFTPASEPLQPGERFQLVFHGLDTFAAIWLNGKILGHSANMFREAVFDVTNSLQTGQNNTLAICFDRPLDHADLSGGFHSWGRNEERVFMRKAQFGFGWDWGPRLPTIGIWRPVELKRQYLAAIDGVNFTTLKIDLPQNLALVAVQVDVDRFSTNKPLEALVELVSDGRVMVSAAIQMNQGSSSRSVTAYLQVPSPRLWWTHDLGEPYLYTLKTTLKQGNTILDSREQKVGIRTIELDQAPDPEERGTRFFRFVLNGIPIFAKGADWIPADSFVGAIPYEHYQKLLILAKEANMNMLRVWGGGIYEHDAFFDLCDSLGILVWHDFMFACAMYPEHDPAFVAEVTAEARYQVRRLRSRASLALWCGNNENQWIHDMRFWDSPNYPVPGVLFYDKILPDNVKELDGHTPYWHGSPYGGNDYNCMEDGDRHNWHVWHGGQPRRFGERPQGDISPEGVTYAHYAEDMGRFISEFGMHAAPVYETLARVIPEDQRYHHSLSMDHHNKDNPKNKGDNLMSATTGLPANLEDYIDLSMLAQAEGLKFGIEHFRRRKPHCSGTLFWQLNDCWPVLSWAVVDYYGFGKAGYYYTRRVYAPILASFKPAADGGLELWITNDTLDEVNDTAVIRMCSFSGKKAWEETLAIHVPPNSSQVVKKWTAEQAPALLDHYVAVRSTTAQFPFNRHFFGMPKDIQRPACKITSSIKVIDEHTVEVRLKTDTYGFFVHLTEPHESTHYSDNYFDLEPGETRTITVSNQIETLDPSRIKVTWR
ncbi:MAG TPA: glycoside hydrolase family 2 protein [Anaerolineaceae bacterium]